MVKKIFNSLHNDDQALGATVARLIFALMLGLLLIACEDEKSTRRLYGSDNLERASEFADLSEMRKAIETIRRHHRSLSSGVELQPGAAAEAIRAIEEGINCTLPRELKELWRQNNGESGEGFIWYHRFLSVKEALAQHKSLTSMSESDWSEDWIPVFQFQDEWYGVLCEPEERIASPVIFYFIEDEPRIVYTNLTRYLQTMAQAMEDGVLVWKKYGWQEDLSLLAELHSALNPGMTFPYHVPDHR